MKEVEVVLIKRIVLPFLVMFLCACQSVPEKAQQETSSGNEGAEEEEFETVAEDPWEKLNRKSHGFNEFADKVALKPAARVYEKVPGFFKKRISNFFTNLSNINNLVNNLLQGKVKRSASDFGRFLTNTTIGLGGLFDPATPMGLAQSDEDWGQTMAKWGVGSGPYLVVPFLGPKTVRGTFGWVLDAFFDPLTWLNPETENYAYYVVVRAVDIRASILPLESVVFGDKYIFYRNAYLQRREYLINDGEVEDAFGDDF